jgi:hypothetical protein
MRFKENGCFNNSRDTSKIFMEVILKFYFQVFCSIFSLLMPAASNEPLISGFCVNYFTIAPTVRLKGFCHFLSPAAGSRIQIIDL